jgi:hypothetical protein
MGITLRIVRVGECRLSGSCCKGNMLEKWELPGS